MGKVVGSRVTRSRLRPWPCTGTPSTSLKLRKSYIKPGSARKKYITEALWGTRVRPSTVYNFNKKIYASIEAWRMRLASQPWTKRV
jgi:hypothetical protein